MIVEIGSDYILVEGSSSEATAIEKTFIRGVDIARVRARARETGQQQFIWEVFVTNPSGDELVKIPIGAVTNREKWTNDQQGVLFAINDIMSVAQACCAGGAGITELTGDVTAGPGIGTVAATISAGVVTNAKLADMAEATFKMRDAGTGTGSPIDGTANEASSVLDTASDPFVRTSALPGIVGDVVGPASAVDDDIVLFDGITGKLIKSAGINLTEVVEESGAGDVGLIESTATSPIILKDVSNGDGTSVQANTGDFQINVEAKNSVEVDAGDVQLVGDTAAPGNSKYYGTNSGGTRGFYDLSISNVTGLGTGVGTALGNAADSASGFVTQTGGDARYIQTSHNIGFVSIMSPGLIDWTSMPAALTFFSGQTRWITPIDLTYRTQIKFYVTLGSVAGFAGSKIRFLYRTQAAGYSTAITDYATLGTSEVQVTIGSSTNVLLTTGFVDIVAGAMAPVIIAVAGIDGNGVESPRFLNISAEMK